MRTSINSFALLMIMGLSDQANATLYTIVDIGALGGADSSLGFGINASGQVTGFFRKQSAGIIEHAFVTNAATTVMTDIGTLGGRFSEGMGINASGQVTGNASTSSNMTHAFVTDATHAVMTDLGTLGGCNSYGLSVNAIGQVAGSSQVVCGEGFHAFVTNTAHTVMTDLGTLGGTESRGMGINAIGQVTGDSYTLGNKDIHAFVTDATHTVMIDLGTLGGRGSYGIGINDNGQVTGWAETSTGGAHAFLTNAAHTVMTDLGSLGGSSQGHAVNAKGQVTGFSFLAGESVRHAFVTDGGNMLDLNALLVSNDAGWLLRDGNGINDAGQISGTGLINGQDHAFLLTPVSSVPSPSTLWLFGAGIAAWLGFGIQKRGMTHCRNAK
jgi:probable HAF family extracellular repeat protein